MHCYPRIYLHKFLLVEVFFVGYFVFHRYSILLLLPPRDVLLNSVCPKNILMMYDIFQYDSVFFLLRRKILLLLCNVIIFKKKVYVQNKISLTYLIGLQLCP